MGLAFLLAGCTNGNEPRKESTKETAKTTIATTTTTSTESKSTATSTETADTSTSSESSKTTETTQTSTSSSSVEASSSSSESSEQVEQTLWNADKSAQLEAFMTTWGQTMGQQYKSYTNQMSVDLYGLKVPQAILNGGVEDGYWWSACFCRMVRKRDRSSRLSNHSRLFRCRDRTISEKARLSIRVSAKSAKSIGDTTKSGESR